MSSLRDLFGEWFQMVALEYTGMSHPTSQTSLSFTRPYASSSDTLPFRKLLTSLPTSARPHSSDSITEKRCRALRFSAMLRCSVFRLELDGLGPLFAILVKAITDLMCSY